jgi:hypothetical protein
MIQLSPTKLKSPLGPTWSCAEDGDDVVDRSCGADGTRHELADAWGAASVSSHQKSLAVIFCAPFARQSDPDTAAC